MDSRIIWLTMDPLVKEGSLVEAFTNVDCSVGKGACPVPLALARSRDGFSALNRDVTRWAPMAKQPRRAYSDQMAFCQIVKRALAITI